jgi:hypothetical protein
MRSVAVVTSPAAFRQWALRQPDLGRLSADAAMGGTDRHDAWTAQRLDSFDDPQPADVHEVVLLPADGGLVATPSDLLPPPAKPAPAPAPATAPVPKPAPAPAPAAAAPPPTPVEAA